MSGSDSQQRYTFAGFQLEPARRLLIGPQGAPVKLTAKAFDALVYLVEHAGDLVDRSTLIGTLWPRAVVEDNNLNQAIAPWSAVTGYTFDTSNSSERSAVSRGVGPVIRLVEASQAPAREGLYYAVVETQNIEVNLDRLRRSGVPLVNATSGTRGKAEVDPAYLNGFSLRFVGVQDDSQPGDHMNRLG